MKKNTLWIVIPVLVLILAVLVVIAVQLHKTSDPSPEPETQPSVTAEPTVPTETQPAPTTEPTEPPIVKQATATVGATGDILLHDAIIQGGRNPETGEYNYDYIFPFFKKYIEKVDYAVANLEVTLAGPDNGYDYKGYPCFNSPDAIVDAAKNAGFDMLLTANNHSYDTRKVGMLRTQQVISQRGLDHIGTRPDLNTPNYLVKDVNGIKIGMINYTYNTSQNSKGVVSLNGISLNEETSPLINSFNYDQLDTFYAKLEGEIKAMKAEGAEAIVLYIHWGDEYHTDPNSYQKKMAQALCELGVDVIVGNHAHVVQPIEFLTSAKDPARKTLCLYSTGNAVSNIYKTSKFPVTTEDGMFFTFTFAKYSDGTVIVERADVLPMWVRRVYSDNTGRWTHTILTLDDQVADWKGAMNLTDEHLEKCKASHKRTMDVVGPGLKQANEYYAAHQADVEKKLGIQ